MGTTGQPVEIKPGDFHVYEAYCDVCKQNGIHTVCGRWVPATRGPATSEQIIAAVGHVPQYCDEHVPPPPPPAPPPVPEYITPAQLRIAVRRVLGIDRGTLEGTVAAIIAGISDPAARGDAQDKWDLATVIERSHPLIDVVRQAFGKTHAEVDDMFRVGATL
jgi:hypothetical protein